MERIICEMGTCGKKVIAEHEDPDVAAELADAAGAIHDNGDEGSGDWICADCYQAHQDEMMNEYSIMEAEAAVRKYNDDAHEHGAMSAYLRAKGEI